MRWQFDDGGRKAAGFKGDAGDCVCRAVAIATGRPYREVYDRINGLAAAERPRTRRSGRRVTRSRARDGVGKATTRALLASYGWRWTPTMQIGKGCTVHLRDGELPPGRLVVQVSKHVVAVIDGVVHDTHDPGRDGTRCCYGFWQPPAG
jgi:hypothetical protein